MRPVSDEFPISQGFGSYATAGVVGNLHGSEVQYLVALYGNYQPFGHAGLDIACPIGTPVRAIADGVVVWAGWGEDLPGDDSWGPSGYFRRWALYKTFPGIVTVIQHDGWLSVYGHLSDNDAAPAGTRVKEGQTIALSGNTKTRTEYVGPHLHVAVVVDTANYSTGGGLIYGCTDPLPYFNTDSLSYASGTITPVTEDDAMTPDQFNNLVAKLDELNANHHVATREHINGKIPDIAKASAEATLKFPVSYRNPETGAETDQTTTLATVVAFRDFNDVQNRLAASTPKEIASLVPAAFVAEVVKLLTERLAN